MKKEGAKKLNTEGDNVKRWDKYKGIIVIRMRASFGGKGRK